MHLRDILFNLNSHITSFPIYILRIAAVDDLESVQNFTDGAILKYSLKFEILFYPAVMIFEGVHMPLTL